ncbi:MAG: ricin-type beta-trefoil lectin domain protein [Streptomyces sp.]|uniref:RICIN domain-containing protein n=1 Tax=Streptomyces sp. TaxID=1931 RepID=UPI0025F4099A|nr:RICIN domain-containing protein [Streptomyces sp.]MBW8794724.1 ricin-type beta-trefoil lectin domain protein [Streptomyces sp.]
MVEDIQGGPPSDTRLTELLRTSTPTAYPALQELRARHHPAVLAYARLCTAGDAAARRLAAQTFTTAARDIARGAEPVVPLRHHLLLLAARLAAGWSGDEHSAALDPTLLLVLNSSGAPGGPTPPLLPAFQSLPSRTQGLLWYGVLDGEPAEPTATYLGLTPEDVRYDTPPALQSLAQACLRTRLAASDDQRCADFRRLIEESVRPENPRHSPDLHAHMAHCPHCTAAFEDLTALRDAPRETLAEGLLPWAGTAYARHEAPPAPPAGPARSRQRRQPSRRLLLTSTALGVALVPLLLVLLAHRDGHAPDPAAATPPPPSPQVTVTATATVSPTPSGASATPSASASASAVSHSPAPTRSARPTPTASPAPEPPGTAYAQVVNLATARCLDVRDGDFDDGTDVVTAPCSGSASQRWRVDPDRGVLQSAADSDFCLDSRGSVDKGVGIWSCDSVDGDHGDNLRFTVTPDGEIRPEIALETALTPSGDDQLSLDPVNDGTGQHWRAGAG